MRKSVETFLSWQYDRLFNKASRLLKKHNPCAFKNGKCLRMRTSTAHAGNCCGDCRHASETGCTVQCLACRTFLCDGVRSKYPSLKRRLDEIQYQARQFAFFCYYRSKEERLKYIEYKYKNDTIIEVLYEMYIRSKFKGLYYALKYLWGNIRKTYREYSSTKYRTPE